MILFLESSQGTNSTTRISGRVRRHDKLQSHQVPGSGALILETVALSGGKPPRGGNVGTSRLLCGGRSPTAPSGISEAYFNNSDDSLGTYLSYNNIGKLRNQLKHLKGLHVYQVKGQGVRRSHAVIRSQRTLLRSSPNTGCFCLKDGRYGTSLLFLLSSFELSPLRPQIFGYHKSASKWNTSPFVFILL